tara:strand:+ start:388 stop:531 length:144 start_codon:yes stop_codon:yes gene_type:complete
MELNYYLIKNINLSLTEIEGMYPWERLVYFSLYMKDLKKQQERSSNG